ncbi:MAG: ABC transporter ATP-binding protein [Candidatus Thermoplasmatota archaeon]|nr:ABC transporter ATP-binding protein [Candidatus Thermoplasmatota archaeon]MBS3790093.1 ABC transporter ATP-binding protein [Candidatus Thermoplasmatota archaeon]
MVNLEVDSLVTGYSGKKILKNISFNVEKGEFLGIIGPNGSGKSTLIRALTQVIPTWNGCVKYDKKKIDHISRNDIAKKVSVVPQDTFINFPFTVRDVVLMGRSPYLGRFENPGKEDIKIAEETMKTTSTLRFKDRSVRDLSGGELQRVVLARALTQKPDLLLLDEATSQLDIGHKKEVMDTIKEKNEKKNLSVISVHHNLNLAARYCEKILLLDDGKKHAYGKPKEVLTNSHLRAVYGVEAEVHEHPKDGSLYVSPVDKKINTKKGEKTVHVICGGNSTGTLLKDLVEKGYEVTAGVLNVMDSDLEKADFLDLEVVTEAPFSSITHDSYEKNTELIKKADVVVVTDFPVGEGNIRNLEGVKEGVTNETELILVDIENIGERDFTEKNRGRELYAEISNKMEFEKVGSTEKVLKLL